MLVLVILSFALTIYYSLEATMPLPALGDGSLDVELGSHDESDFLVGP
jgi:hypothetical protein